MEERFRQWPKIILTMALSMSIGIYSYTVFAAESFEGDDQEQDSEAPVVDNTETAAIDTLGPFGGNMWDVAVDSERGYVYTVAKDSPNGFFRSDNGGESWSAIENADLGGSTAIEINEATGSIFVSFSRALYKSTDNGVTFTSILEDNGGALLYAQDMLMMSSNRSEGSVQMSSDDGETFSESVVATGQNIWALASSPTAGTFYALAYEDSTPHMYRSTNSGENWSEVTIPESSDGFVEMDICVNPQDASNLVLTQGNSTAALVSINAGESWSETTAYSVNCTFDQEGRVYVGEYYSDDKGETWSTVGQDNSVTSSLGGHNLTVDPSDVNTLYVDGMPGLTKSTDRGATWTDINEGITAVTITDISQAEDKNIVWAAAYNGVAKTENFTDENPTWQFPVLDDPATAIWVKPDDVNIVVVGEIGLIKRSIDGGETWSENVASQLSHTYQVNEIIQDVTDANTLYASVMNGEPTQSKRGMVLKSTDLGETWEDMSILDDASAQTISQASNGDLYVGAGAESGEAYKKGIYTYSAGAWTHLENGPDEEVNKILVDPEDDSVVYALASIKYGNNNEENNFGFYKSEDAGATWTKITEGLDMLTEYNSLAIQASSTPNTLYVGATNRYGQGVLLKSSDAGDTWATFYTGLQEETFYTLLFDGMLAGTSRGLFDLKSKATVQLKKVKTAVQPNVATLQLTLKDAVTEKKLRKKKVKIYKKTKSGLKQIRSVKTNGKGKAKITIKQKAKKQQIKAVWDPKGIQAEEYTQSSSQLVKIKKATQ